MTYLFRKGYPFQTWVITIILILFSNLLNAEDAAKTPCTDLAKIACKAGKYNDGTGTATTLMKGEFTDSNRKKIYDKMNSFYLSKIRTDDALALFGLTLVDKKCTALYSTREKGKMDFKKLYSIFLRINKEKNINQEIIKDWKKTIPLDWNDCEKRIVSKLIRLAEPKVFPSYTNFDPLKSYREFKLKDELEHADNPVFQGSLMELAPYLKSEFTDTKFIDESKRIFSKAKKYLVQIIDRTVTDSVAKERLKKKVESISFTGTDCQALVEPDKVSKKLLHEHAGMVDGLLIPNAYYNPLQNNFRFCNGWGTHNNSWFSAIFVIAHELTHSIDPCAIGLPYPDSKGIKVHRAAFSYSKPWSPTASMTESPFKNILGCLRSSQSISAKRNPDFAFASFPSEIRHKFNSFCSLGNISIDQIGESFADVVASEVLSLFMQNDFPKRFGTLTSEQYRLGLSNVLRSVEECSPTKKRSESFNMHPSDRDRINKILMAHPDLRRRAGCPPTDDDLKFCLETTTDKGVPLSGAKEQNATKLEQGVIAR